MITKPDKIVADYMHTAVNPLAGEEHLKEVIQQLQLMGEVAFLQYHHHHYHPKNHYIIIIIIRLSTSSAKQATTSSFWTRNGFAELFVGWSWPQSSGITIIMIIIVIITSGNNPPSKYN